MVTTITDRSMMIRSARRAARNYQTLQPEIAIVDEGEGVAWVMAMPVLEEAGETKIIVRTVMAGNQLRLVEV
jgi:hypothetical protein